MALGENRLPAWWISDQVSEVRDWFDTGRIRGAYRRGSATGNWHRIVLISIGQNLECYCLIPIINYAIARVRIRGYSLIRNASCIRIVARSTGPWRAHASQMRPYWFTNLIYIENDRVIHQPFTHTCSPTVHDSNPVNGIVASRYYSSARVRIPRLLLNINSRIRIVARSTGAWPSACIKNDAPIDLQLENGRVRLIPLETGVERNLH